MESQHGDEEVGGAIYDILLERPNLSACDLSRRIKRSPERINRCLKLLERQNLVVKINENWCVATLSEELDRKTDPNNVTDRLSGQLEETSLKSIYSSGTSSKNSYSSETRLKDSCSSETRLKDSCSSETRLKDSCSSETSLKNIYLSGTSLNAGSIFSSETNVANTYPSETRLKNSYSSETSLKRPHLSDTSSEETVPKQSVPISAEVPSQESTPSSEFLSRLHTVTEDPLINGYYDKFKKILHLFKKSSTKDISPKDVAQKCDIGSSKKYVNSLLYHLEKNGVLTKTCESGNSNPRWNKVSDAKLDVPDDLLSEWAAELARKSDGKVKERHDGKNFYIQIGDNNQMNVVTGSKEKTPKDSSAEI